MAVTLHDARGITEGLPARLERKFYLPPERVDMAYGLLRTLARPDREFPAEEIHSLYFDTADLDELEHSLSGEYRKNKVRIRWYGSNCPRDEFTTCFLELKSRQGFASTKQRRKLQVPSASLLPRRLAAGIIPANVLLETLAGFGLFPGKSLLPLIKISYLRFRFRDVETAQSLALDCHIRSTPAGPGTGRGERELELSGAVLEVKGTAMELPVFLRPLSVLGIDWTQYSKYAACVNAHREKAGAEGRLSPGGRNVSALPVLLREPGRAEPDWNRLFPLPFNSQSASGPHDGPK